MVIHRLITYHKYSIYFRENKLNLPPSKNYNNIVFYDITSIRRGFFIVKKKVFLVSLFIAFIVVVFFLYYPRNYKAPVIDAHQMNENFFMEEGYVVSRGLRSLWISDEKNNFWKGLIGLRPSGSIQIYQHKLHIGESIFKGIKHGDLIRVKGEFLGESNPAVIYAYSVEVLE